MTVRIIASRHSAFYTPLISTMAAGFLEQQGMEFSYSVLRAGETASGLIRDGKVDVVQSAPSSNWARMEKGEADLPLHFAMINQRDGFFIVGREKDSGFEWKKLEGRTLLADHGAQPLAMLRYAIHYNGIDWSTIRVVDAGKPDEMVSAFRGGKGDFIHLQAPAPQLLEEQGLGSTVASVGASMPANAFSTLCAGREFLESDKFAAFAKAFADAKEWVRRTPAEEIAAREASYFPDVHQPALIAAISRYKSLGNWDGGSEVPRDLYEQSLNVFEYAGAIGERHPYEKVCLALTGRLANA
jgi:NitT/TauT family transport system substrate-binding protein